MSKPPGRCRYCTTAWSFLTIFLLAVILAICSDAILPAQIRHRIFLRHFVTKQNPLTPYNLSETSFYGHFYATANESYPSFSLRHVLSKIDDASRNASTEDLPMRSSIKIEKGVSVEPAQQKDGYEHSDELINPICLGRLVGKVTNAIQHTKPMCLSAIYNAFVGPGGTAVQPSTGTTYEFGGGCCVWDWKKRPHTNMPLSRRDQVALRKRSNRVILVLAQHHAVTYHHIIAEVLPRFLSVVKILESRPDIVVAVSAGEVVMKMLNLLGLEKKRILQIDEHGNQWEFASVLLYPRPVFGHSKEGYFSEGQFRATAGVLRGAVHLAKLPEEGVARRPILLLLERAVTRNRKGVCREQRCLRNFGKLHKALQRAFDDRFKVVIFGAKESLETSIRQFSQASVVVGVHGAGFQNMMFCKEGTVVVHIGWDRHYEGLANEFGLKYYPSMERKLTRGSVSFTVDVSRVVRDVAHAIGNDKR